MGLRAIDRMRGWSRSDHRTRPHCLAVQGSDCTVGMRGEGRAGRECRY